MQYNEKPLTGEALVFVCGYGETKIWTGCMKRVLVHRVSGISRIGYGIDGIYPYIGIIFPLKWYRYTDTRCVAMEVERFWPWQLECVGRADRTVDRTLNVRLCLRYSSRSVGRPGVV